MQRRRTRGFTLVEMLVGLAVGLLIVAAATAFVLGQIRDLRARWIESRLMHDLRIAAEVVARDLRRAGHWSDATATAWSAEGAGPMPANPHAPLLPASSPSNSAHFSYSHGEHADTPEGFGFRLHAGVIEMLLGDGHWQALTDAGSVVVTAFTIAPQVQQLSLQASCARACRAGTPCAPPEQSVRSVNVSIRARAAADERVVRSVQGLVRLRNDVVTGACPS
jgi:type IV pilus assembly protein PilW